MLSAICFVLAASTPKVGGWVVFWNPKSLATFEQRAKQLEHVGAEWIECTSDGVARRRDTEATGDQRRTIVEIAHKSGVKLLGLAGNSSDDDFSAKYVEAFLNDETKLNAHVDALVAIAKEDRLDGIDLDYESLEAKDRDPFSHFVEVLARALHKNRLLLDVAVHAKESEPGTWGGPAAQDLARIGAAADVVRVMCYDNHWLTSEAGPISPTDWCERVMRHALTLVPAAKLEMGIAGYGYDWSVTPAVGPTWDDWAKVSGADKATIDPSSGELTTGKAYFSGSESNRRKIDLAKRLGLRGVALWYVGSEDPEFWNAVKSRS